MRHPCGRGRLLWRFEMERHASSMVGDMTAQRYIAEMHYDTQALCIW